MQNASAQQGEQGEGVKESGNVTCLKYSRLVEAFNGAYNVVRILPAHNWLIFRAVNDCRICHVCTFQVFHQKR